MAGSSTPGQFVPGQAHPGALGGPAPTPPSAYYTENLCPNPSVEVDLTGFAALTGTIVTQDITQGKYGRSSMFVETDGAASGEGFTTPQAIVPATGTGSMSFYIMGQTGTLTVSAISGASAVVIAQTSVTLTGGDYQRVVLPGLSLTTAQAMYLVVQTTTAQALSFWVDAFQYEMNATPHPYIDGSFLNCTWEGTAGLSASNQPFQNMTSAKGGMLLEGRATPVAEGQIVTTSAKGTMLLSGTETGTLTVNPVGALSDFGVWTAADMDPAVSYSSYSNAQTSSGQAAWNRIFGVFYPPVQTFGSGGTVLWNRAAFAAVGFIYKAVTATWQQSLTDVQIERVPVTAGASPGASAWTPPRQVTTVVKPTRLNFCPNPGIEVSAAGWTPVGSAVVSQDAVITPVNGSKSLKVTVNASADGCYITIPNLIVGDTYTASAYVQGGPGLLDVTMAVSGASTSSANQGVPYGGNAILSIGYGQGPYGGIQAAGSDMPTGQWFRPGAVFVAQQSTVVLSFQIIPGSDIAYPTHFWVDSVLVETGDLVGSYFDGGFGTDYSWETAGTPGLTRSYYYNRQEVSAGAVATALSTHTPLGIAAATPVYSSPYSQ